MCRVHEKDDVSVLKSVLCSVMNVSHFIDTNTFNTVINIKKIQNCSIMYFRPGKKSQSLGDTILICHKQTASFLSHQRGRHYSSGNTTSHSSSPPSPSDWVMCNSSSRRKITLVIFANDLFVTMSLSSAFVTMELLWRLFVGFGHCWKKAFFYFVVSSGFLSEVRWHIKILNKSCRNVFRKDIFIQN